MSHVVDVSVSRDYTRNLFEVIRTLTYRLNFIADDPLLNKLAALIEPRVEDFLNRILGF